MLEIAQVAHVSESTVSRLENAVRWVDEVEQIVEAYESACGLPDGELWRHAVLAASDTRRAR